MIYLDNAATTWPKPESVTKAVADTVVNVGGNPGRSGHKFSIEAGSIVERGRFALAQFFNIKDPTRIVFTLNATDSLNLAISGILKAGDHVITSNMEHNSVARPLEYKRRSGVEVTKLETDPEKGVDLEQLKKEIKGNTKLVALTHASNVTGTLDPIEDIAEICNAAGVPLLVDASQSAGVIDIDAEKLGKSLIAFPGHKSLLGPTGTGGLYVSPDVDISVVRSGGSGVDSEYPIQPEEMPFYLEAGTQNFVGIAGLTAGIEYIQEKGISVIRMHEMKCIDQLLSGLRSIPGVKIYGPQTAENRAAVLSFNIEGVDCAEVAMILDTSFDLAVRSGLHCAPDTHRMLGTFGIGGTVRVSPGCFTTSEEISAFIEAVSQIAEAF